MNDFVAEINETVREAKKEIDTINRELRQIPFGNDTYKFIMKEKPDRSVMCFSGFASTWKVTWIPLRST